MLEADEVRVRGQRAQAEARAERSVFVAAARDLGDDVGNERAIVERGERADLRGAVHAECRRIF